MKKLFVLMAITMIALAGFTTMAGATLSFDLGLGNLALAGYPTPFATVNVTRTGATTADIEFIGLHTGIYQYLFGGNGAVAVNVNASSWTIGAFTGTNAGVGFVPGPLSDGGAANEDGFNSFNQTVDSFDGVQHSSDYVKFTLTNTSGTWANDAAVLTGNADGYRAAVHIFATTFPANAANGAVVTGYATEGGGNNVVPEPTSMLLLGLGLVGAGAARRRKKS